MRLLTGLLLFSLLSGCGPQYLGPPIGDRSAAPANIPGQHTVRSGDTLFSIAFMYGVTVEELADWNRIHEPYTIYKGQPLRLTPPPAAVAVAPSPPRPPPLASQPKIQHRQTALPAPSMPKTSAAPRPVSAPPRTSGVVAPSQPKTPAPVEPVQTAAAASTPEFASRLTWGWPADGRLVRRFDTGNTGSKGIDIAGQAGAPVRAAAPGKVVYAGSGLSGYGRLIIIKHNDDFLSAYAHNRKLLATEGQWVEKQEVIAHMGSSGADRTALHFEIRKRGRPVNPLDYLPGR